MKPRLVVNLVGGLGNQLFQYACGWAAAHEHGMDLVLDTGAFDQYKLRMFLLDRLNVKARVASKNELKAWGLQGGRFSRLRRRIFGIGITTVREKAFTWIPLEIAQGQDIWLNGYWQSERYFSGYKKDLKLQFTAKTAASGANAILLKTIKIAGAKACAVHVRRGDYVSNAMAARTHGAVGLAYYANAVARLKARVKGAKLFIFSDDPKWAREHLPFASQARLIDVNPPESPELDLRLMSACRHFILANSSFSWWGAWLGEKEDSLIYAPKRWFKTSKLDDRDLLPERWHRVESDPS